MDYLRQMLLWQFPSGCFGDRETETDDSKVDIDSLLQSYQEGQTHFLHKSATRNLVNKFHIENNASIAHKSHTLNLMKHNNMKEKEKVLVVETKLIHVSTPGVNLKDNTRYFEVNKSQDAGKFYKLKDGMKAGRHLLNEKQMNDGCLSHKTAVAAGALCIYLRYLIEPGNIQWNGQHELFLMDMRSLLQAKGEGQIKLTDLEDEKNNNQGEVVEAVAEDEANYQAEEEDEEEEEGEGEEGYNEGGGDYVTEQPVKVLDKVHPGNPGIQFDHRDNDNIIVNDDNEQELMDYSNVREDPNAQQHMALPNKADDTREQQEDHNYYDDEGEAEKGIIKRARLITPRPHPPIRTRKKHGGSIPVSSEYIHGPDLHSDQPNYIVIVLVSMTPFFVLFIFLLKFGRRRRVHTRHHF